METHIVNLFWPWGRSYVDKKKTVIQIIKKKTIDEELPLPLPSPPVCNYMYNTCTRMAYWSVDYRSLSLKENSRKYNISYIRVFTAV